MYGIVGNNYQDGKKEKILTNYYYQSLFTLQLNWRAYFYLGIIHGHRKTTQPSTGREGEELSPLRGQRREEQGP